MVVDSAISFGGRAQGQLFDRGGPRQGGARGGRGVGPGLGFGGRLGLGLGPLGGGLGGGFRFRGRLGLGRGVGFGLGPGPGLRLGAGARLGLFFGRDAPVLFQSSRGGEHVLVDLAGGRRFHVGRAVGPAAGKIDLDHLDGGRGGREQRPQSLDKVARHAALQGLLHLGPSDEQGLALEFLGLRRGAQFIELLAQASLAGGHGGGMLAALPDHEHPGEALEMPVLEIHREKLRPRASLAGVPMDAHHWHSSCI